MAAFYNEAPPTNDPNYSGASRGFSDVRPNTAVGEALKGLGGMVDAGAKGLYSAVNDTLKDQIRAAVEPITQAHGGNVTPEEAPAIAGTGARGARYQVAGMGEDLAQDSALPGAVQAGLSKLDRMKAAYQSGAMSDTRYSAELEAQVQKFRSQYPQWKDEIDQHVSQITGQVPANALRASILRDMNSMAFASGATQKKLEAWVDSHEKDIGLAFPGTSRTWRIEHATQLQNDPSVMQLKFEAAVSEREENQFKSLDNSNKYKGTLGEQFLRQEGGRMVSGALTGALNTSGLNVQSIIQNGIKDDETLKSTLPALQQLKAQLSAKLDQTANNYDPNDPKSAPVARFLKDGQLGKVKDDVLAPIQNVIDLITNGKASEALLYANTNKIHKEATMAALKKYSPALGTAEALHGLGGDNLVGIITKNLAANAPFIQSLVLGSYLNSVTPGAPKRSITETTDMMPTKQMAPNDFRKLIDTQTSIITQHKDPQAKSGAVQTLFDNMDHYTNMSPKAQMQLFRQTARPDIANEVFKLGGEPARQYSAAVQKMFNTTFAQGAQNLDEVLRSGDYTVVQDPKTLQFTVTALHPNVKRGRIGRSGDEYNSVTGEPRPQGRMPGQDFVDNINYGISALLPVLQHSSPGQELTALSQILGGLGVQFGAPKDKGFGAQIGQAVIKAMAAGGEQEKQQAEELLKMYKENKASAGPLPSAYPSSQFKDELGTPNLTAWLAAHGNTKKPAGTPKPVNVSDWGHIDRIDVDQIPEGMDARTFIKALKENPR